MPSMRWLQRLKRNEQWWCIVNNDVYRHLLLFRCTMSMIEQYMERDSWSPKKGWGQLETGKRIVQGYFLGQMAPQLNLEGWVIAGQVHKRDNRYPSRNNTRYENVMFHRGLMEEIQVRWECISKVSGKKKSWRAGRRPSGRCSYIKLKTLGCSFREMGNYWRVLIGKWHG